MSCSVSENPAVTGVILRVLKASLRQRATLLVLFLILSACNSRKGTVGPSIKLPRVPQAVQENLDRVDIIQGNVSDARPGQQIVLYVKTGKWSIQPLSNFPFTNIRPDTTWINSTHMGSEYAALLVDAGYQPP